MFVVVHAMFALVQTETMAPISDEKRDLARKLRVVEKKTIREICSLLGISIGVMAKWCAEEGWPDPQKERRELNRIAAQGFPKVTRPEPEGDEAADHAPQPGSSGRKSKAQRQLESLLPFPSLQAGTLDEPIEDMVERLFRFSSGIVAEAARFDVRTAIKLMESSARVLVAVRTPPPPPDAGRFGVMVPAQSETYRDPPPEPNPESAH